MMTFWRFIEWLRRLNPKAVGGRRIDFTPYRCGKCKRVTPSRWLRHDYLNNRNFRGEYDVDYTAFCKCGNDVFADKEQR